MSNLTITFLLLCAAAARVCFTRKTDQMINIRNLIRTTFLLTQENLLLMLMFTFPPLIAKITPYVNNFL